MKATEANLLKFMQKPKQMIVPIYQRKYSWTLQQCKKLWQDIERVISNPTINSHFIGSVVYIDDEGSNIADIAKFMLIDGQQRLTTTTLLLFALGQAFKDYEEDEKTQRKINNYYLFNNDEEGKSKYRLLPTEADEQTLLSLLEENELPKERSVRIVENYDFFVQQIKKSPYSVDEILEGVRKLVIVDTSLQRGTDDPQLIFESLNSTGLDLSQVDLIRNYILMGLDRTTQNEIYTKYWRKMEVEFEKSENKALFDKFFRDYLTIKTNNIPKKDEIYQVFKKFVIENRAIEVDDLVADIYKYAKIFFKIAFQTEEDNDIHHALSDIAELDMDVVYPFLIEVFADYQDETIQKDELVEIIRMIESYIFRRSVCDIPTNALNKIFATLKKEVNEECYLESVKAKLLLMETYKRFPTNKEFQERLESKELYNSRNMKYLLKKLENYNRKEKVNVDEYTIEHVLPQNKNLSNEWKDELGYEWERIQETYLHTLGNLTLTGYNSEMSDRPYQMKKTYFNESPLKLNASIRVFEHWNEEAIQQRAKELSSLAYQKIWKFPLLDEETLEQYKPKQEIEVGAYDLAHHYEKMSEETKAIFEQLKGKIMQLDEDLIEKYNKYYIALKYKNAFLNFVDITGKKTKIMVHLNIKYEELNDSKGICRNVTQVGTWGNGNAEISVHSLDQIDDVMELVLQVYEKYKENK